MYQYQMEYVPQKLQKDTTQHHYFPDLLLPIVIYAIVENGINSTFETKQTNKQYHDVNVYNTPLSFDNLNS